jgi:O-antigen/teichoic acid export membrane protein
VDLNDGKSETVIGVEIFSEDLEQNLAPPEEQAPCAPAPAATAQKSFLTHAAIYGLGAMALQMASVVLVPIYTRYFTPAEYGVLEILGRIGEVFNLCFLANGIRLAAFTFYCQAKEDLERRRTAATVLFAPLLLFLGCGLLATGFTPWLAGLTGIADSRLVIMALVLVMLEGLTVVPLALVQARVESAYYVTIMAAMFVVRVTLTILAVVGLGWGVWGVLTSAAATSAFFGLLLTWREFRKNSWRPDLKTLKEVLKFSLPFVPVGICGMLLHNGDRFFLMNFCGADEVGQYALGYKLAVTAGALSTGPILQVWTARMYDAFELPDAALYVGRVCTRILAVYLFACLGLCLLDKELLLVLAKPSYHGAIAVIVPVTLAYFFWTLSNLMDAPLWVRRRSGLKPWIILASASVTLVLYLWLIPRYGALGAAYATLAGLAIHCGITFLVSQRVFYVRYEFGRLAVMLALAVAMVVAAQGVQEGPAGIVEKLALWAAWPLALWFGGVITAEEKTWARAACWRACSSFGKKGP